MMGGHRFPRVNYRENEPKKSACSEGTDGSYQLITLARLLLRLRVGRHHFYY